jgi:hypothetical protein
MKLEGKVAIVTGGHAGSRCTPAIWMAAIGTPPQVVD